jgi:superfamily II DNA or RNA helicase
MSPSLAAPNTGQPALSFQGGVLLLQGWSGSPGKSLGIEWRYQAETGGWVANAARYRDVKKDGLVDSVPSWQVLEPLDEANLHTPRGAQVEAITAWKKAGYGMVWMPTGTGKTEVAMHIIKDLMKPALIIAPTRDLMYQWHRRILKGLGYDSGLIGDSHQIIKPISVATYHSACIHMPKLGNRFELVIFDEVHHLPGEVRGDASRMCAAPYRLGLTATPPQGLKLDQLIELAGPPVFQQHIHEAAGDSLANYEIVKCPVDMSDEERTEYDRLGKLVSEFFGKKRKDGELSYSTEDLAADSARDSEVRKVLRAHYRRRALEARAVAKLDVVEDLLLLHPETPTIIWGADRQAARDISARFLIPCMLSHCGKDERGWILDGFQQGKFKAIVSCRLLDEGVDLPTAKIGINLGGDASERRATQKLGRILRKTAGVKAIFYDIFCADSSDETRAKARRPKAPEKPPERLLC